MVGIGMLLVAFHVRIHRMERWSCRLQADSAVEVSGNTIEGRV